MTVIDANRSLVAEDKAFDADLAWHEKDQKRVDREWAVEWDGTEESGAAINDRQCERLEQAQKRLGVTPELLRKRFRNMELVIA